MSAENTDLVPVYLRNILEQTDTGKQSLSNLEQIHTSAETHKANRKSHGNKKFIALGIGIASGAIIPGVNIPFVLEYCRQFALEEFDRHKEGKDIEKMEDIKDKIFESLSDEELKNS